MRLDRRQILKGFSLGASSLLLAPVVRQLEAQAAGDATPQKRFVFVLEGNGVNPDQVQPTSIPRKKNAHSQNDSGAIVDQPISADDLPFALEPLKPLVERTTIVQGLSGRVCGGGHSNNFGALGVYSAKKGPAGETIDAALAKTLPAVFPHIGLGISDRPEHTIIYNCSAWDTGKAMPTQCRPDLAYNSLFGSVAGGSAREEFNARTNLLDFMADDIKRLESRLAGEERSKLQTYLHAFESMRDRQSRLNEIEHTLREKGPVVSDKYQSTVETDRLDAHFDLAAAALVSGLTNVVTLSSGAGDPYFSVRFKGLGIDLDKHSIGHGRGLGDKTWADLSSTIRRFHIEQVAKLASRLAEVPEGDGTMLDNTVIVYLSDAAEGHHSRCWEWPMIVIGNVGGKLTRGGRFLNYPKYGETGHRTTANFYTTLLELAGAPRERFGLADPNLKHLDQNGPLNQLLA